MDTTPFARWGSRRPRPIARSSRLSGKRRTELNLVTVSRSSRVGTRHLNRSRRFDSQLHAAGTDAEHSDSDIKSGQQNLLLRFSGQYQHDQCS
jgi:hypothetical protein